MIWFLEHVKKYEEALNYCEHVLEINPNYVYALSYKGKLLYEMQRFEEALEFYNKVLEIDPHNQRALYFKNNIVAKLSKKRSFSFLNRFRN